MRTARWAVRGRRATTALALLAALCVPLAWAADETPTQPSNRDIYYQETSSAPTGAVESPPAGDAQPKPTVRYWVERDTGEGARDIVVAKDDAYRSGDRIWLNFAINVDCYAYLVAKGTTGNVSMLFPGIAGDDNQVTAHAPKVIPSIDQPFVFDANPGKEELCLLVSPQPIQELEQIAAQARNLDGLLKLGTDEASLWEEVAQTCKGLQNSRDLTFERYDADSGGEPGNYVTDHSGAFSEPIKLYITLEHKP